MAMIFYLVQCLAPDWTCCSGAAGAFRISEAKAPLPMRWWLPGTSDNRIVNM
jgi:hypothetical protein